MVSRVNKPLKNVNNEAVLLQESKVYQEGEKLEVRGVLHHLDISHGEGRQNNTKLRIIYPSWLAYVRKTLI